MNITIGSPKLMGDQSKLLGSTWGTSMNNWSNLRGTFRKTHHQNEEQFISQCQRQPDWCVRYLCLSVRCQFWPAVWWKRYAGQQGSAVVLSDIKSQFLLRKSCAMYLQAERWHRSDRSSHRRRSLRHYSNLNRRRQCLQNLKQHTAELPAQRVVLWCWPGGRPGLLHSWPWLSLWPEGTGRIYQGIEIKQFRRNQFTACTGMKCASAWTFSDEEFLGALFDSIVHRPDVSVFFH